MNQDSDDHDCADTTGATNVSGSRRSASEAKHYQWQIQDGDRWLDITHDLIIEVHYTRPGAKGIKLNTRDYGNIFLDFDKMTIRPRNLRVRRQNFLSAGQAEDYRWYFFDNRRWHEYGSQGSTNATASMGSCQIEQQYQRNPRGTCQFTVGQTSYVLDLRAMTQTNTVTGMRRCVRRRPKFNSVNQQKGNSVPLPNVVSSASVSSAPLSGSWIWQFQGDFEEWSNYEKKTRSGVVCSVNSNDIEQSYQQNPQGTLAFTTGRFHYTLDFSQMFQTNTRTAKRRSVRRIPAVTQVAARLQIPMKAPGPSLLPSTNSYVWQFRGDEDIWCDYDSNTGIGIACSITSDTIEQHYQQNPLGSIQFSTNFFKYTLDFSRMVQINNLTGTKRTVQRLPAASRGATGSSSPVMAASLTPSNWTWQFLADEGVWTEYSKNNGRGINCSVDSDGIEQMYQQNPQGVMQFTAGNFTYTLNFAELVQVNNQTRTKRMVRRLASTTPEGTANSYLNDYDSDDYEDYW